jgi:hypothetical protein
MGPICALLFLNGDSQSQRRARRDPVEGDKKMNPTLSPTGSPEGNFTMSNIIDSLKRLERIGDETSKTTQKLIESARELADNIETELIIRDRVKELRRVAASEWP